MSILSDQRGLHMVPYDPAICDIFSYTYTGIPFLCQPYKHRHPRMLKHIEMYYDVALRRYAGGGVIFIHILIYC